MKVATVGLDIAKHVFQAHATDERGRPTLRRRLRRGQVLEFFAALEPCVVGIEAGSTAHHWAREIGRLGHEVRLVPPQYVRPYVKRQKNDAADAEAIAEAVTRPTMRFVAVKTVDQQAMQSLHRARALLVRQKRMLANAIRGLLAEFGIVASAGIWRLPKLVEAAMGMPDGRLPGFAKDAVAALARQFDEIGAKVEELEARILAWHSSSDLSRRLATIPGVGPLTATALCAAVVDPGRFANARQFAAWLGLVPRQHSTGGRDRLGAITKRGDAYLRRLLVTGAQSVLRWARLRPAGANPWIGSLLGRRPPNVVATAMANKAARIAWALMTSGETYRSARA